jgi:Astacin (Peptidase family M12A)
MSKLLCAVPPAPVRPVPEDADPRRTSLIRAFEKKWVNGSIIKYHFMEDPGLVGSERDKDLVRKGWNTWKGVGIGLRFQECSDREQSDCRISFKQDGSSWSNVGRDVLTVAKTEPTMNLGWDISTDNDAIIHEIGHTLGMQHEHQNPNAGVKSFLAIHDP